MFGNIFSLVLPKQKCISHADAAFDEAGNLKDSAHQNDVLNLGKGLAQFLSK
jgi:hypothetical protein